MKTKIISLAAFMVFALFIGCSNPERAYQKAKDENTIEAYKEFVEKFPESEKVDSAKTKIRELRHESAYKKAKNENTIKAYEEFIKEFPESEKVDSFKMKLRALRPEQGKWIGNNIQFNVSQDGKAINKQNSSLENTCSVIIKVFTRGYSMEIYIYEEVEIKDDGSFYIKEQKKGGISRSGFLTINGKFDSTSTVSGIFTLTDYGEDKLKGSTKWKAYPKK